MAAELSPEHAPSRAWLSIVGIGEDGADGLGQRRPDGRCRRPNWCSAACVTWRWPRR